MGYAYFPTVLIHCWGGLGSQLYAWSLSIQLQEKHPKRNFVLVLHNSGVTRRHSELFDLVDKSEIIEVNDFESIIERSPDSLRKFRVTGSASRIILFIADFLGVTLSPDRKSQIPRVFPWTKSIRGHYSHLVVTSKVIKELLSNPTFGHQDSKQLAPVIGLHYRLGDLLTLNNKSPMPGERLAKSVLQISHSAQIKDIDLYSDSPLQARQRLVLLEKELTLRDKDVSIWDTIKFLSQSSVFVGTHSKISLWVCILRSECNKQGTVFVPVEMKKDIFRNLIDPDTRASFNFY
jgi:hypothetical protein